MALKKRRPIDRSPETPGAGEQQKPKLARSVWDRPKMKALLAQPIGTPVKHTRAEAVAIVKETFGCRPDLPPGDEYVRSFRGNLGASLEKRRRGNGG